MKASISNILLHLVCICCCYLLIQSQDVAKLPYCNEDIKHSELILVSTLDGSLSALKPTGELSWQIETGPGALLNSNIHKLELTNNGELIRIIPSLSGSLYKFNKITIDPIPITADTLLTSSFRYSDDLLIAGGREVRTYGVLLNSGKQLYECSLQGCSNITDYSDDMEDIIIIERKTHTVRAVEPRTGTERWNFSVGQHSIKIPYISCIDVNLKTSNINISAVLPEGLLIASKTTKSTEVLWRQKFEAPIVAVWRWNGRELIPLNLFSPSAIINSKSSANAASIYVGMHNKQLYIHESLSMQNILQLKQHVNHKDSVIESQSVTQIPWKPVPAVSMTANNIDQDSDDSTALSVLYGSEYVNGNGYYLYMEDKTICESNRTGIPFLPKRDPETILYWWKEVFVVALTTVMICNVMYNYQFFQFGRKKKVESDVPSQYVTRLPNNSYSDCNELLFTSRYLTEFEPICCLGKGGFGVVFQAKKKFDECDYAIKRIRLPNKRDAKDRMMREVKALAKLDHRHIVRYYNAWLECPPNDWQRQHDQQWLSEFSASYIENSVNTQGGYSKMESSLAINVESNFPAIKVDTVCERNRVTTEESSSIVFERSSTASTALQTNTTDLSESQCEKDELNLLDVHSTFPSPVYLYIQMQLCCKESLKEWLSSNPERKRSYALSIFHQIVEAVAYVHFRGLIHRDLKPSNIFFSLEGQIKIGDFGLVTSIKDYADSEDDLSSTPLKNSLTNAVGTQLYMSPEQLKCQQYDYKVDIYSLGIILFELLVPFTTEMERITILTDLRNHKYPEGFSSSFHEEYELLKLMLSIDPQNRPTATELRKIKS